MYAQDSHNSTIRRHGCGLCHFPGTHEKCCCGATRKGSCLPDVFAGYRHVVRDPRLWPYGKPLLGWPLRRRESGGITQAWRAGCPPRPRGVCCCRCGLPRKRPLRDRCREARARDNRHRRKGEKLPNINERGRCFRHTPNHAIANRHSCRRVLCHVSRQMVWPNSDRIVGFVTSLVTTQITTKSNHSRTLI